jgi:hypothetical protein
MNQFRKPIFFLLSSSIIIIGYIICNYLMFVHSPRESVESQLGGGMIGLSTLVLSILISAILSIIGLFRKEKSRIILLVFPIVIILIIVEFLISESYHRTHNIGDKRDESITIDNNIELSKIAKNYFGNLNIESYGNIIFEQMSSNEYCNWSKYLIIYTYEGDEIDICNKIVSKFNIFKDYNYIDTKQPVCHSHNIKNRIQKNGAIIDISEKRTGASGNINDQHNPIFYSFQLSFFQNDSNYPYFLPTNHSYEEKIINYVKTNNYKFYYFNFEYQGNYDKGKYLYKCNETTGENCKCNSSVYTDAIFPDGSELKEFFINNKIIKL